MDSGDECDTVMEIDGDARPVDLRWEIKKLEEKKLSTNWDTDLTKHGFPRREFDVVLDFSCRTTLATWVIKNNDERLMSVEQEGPLLENSIHVDHKKYVFYSDETHEIIKKSITGWDWPISNGEIGLLAESVVCEVGEIFDSITAPGLYWLKVAVEVENEENQINYEDDDSEEEVAIEVENEENQINYEDDDSEEEEAIEVSNAVNLLYYVDDGDLMMADNELREEEDLMVTLQQSINESGPVMIPASNSSIESLKTKLFVCDSEDRESCSICLEEFVNGCEIMLMPCKHHFHNHCISEWLGTSHYCPNCRFELP